jgi:hypothetical protein
VIRLENKAQRLLANRGCNVLCRLYMSAMVFALVQCRRLGKDADPDIPILKQAQAEYANLN